GDCDGFADEDLGHTTCGVGECKNTVQNCVNGVPQECVPGNPSPEVCDLVDNDCDGFIDEELGSTTCGVGECKKTVENCVNGIPQECVPGLPSAEICDGKDNDCDGKIDEDCGFIGDQVWEDGNRNGVVDSGETGIDGVKVILKKGGTPVASQFTSGGGFYGFGNLLAGSFSVHVDESTLPPLPPGQKWVMPTGTNPINVSLGAGQFVYNADFGYMKAIPCLEFSKSGPFKAKKGETVTYSFTVHNCGTVWLYGGVTVYDEMLNPYGDHQIWYSHVGPGETKTFTKTYTIPGGAADPLCNLAKARGCPEFGLPFVWKESKHCIDLCSGSDETCNGADDDCDGFTDEDYKPYSCGVGECAASSLCVNGGESCTPKQPCQEVCDGKDNDCDGKTDEDLGSTTCGKGICQKTVQNCVNGVPQQCVPGESELEICDKLDNDCDGQTDEGFPAGCKNVCIVSDACVGISEGFARGWIDVSDPSADGAVVLLKNYGNKDVCMDDTIVQVSDATQSHALQPFSHTGYSPPTPGSQLKIPAGGQLYYYYASWTFANGYYHPYLAKPPWWCLEWGQLAKGPAIFFFDGETLPDTLKYYGYNSTDTNSNGKEDHVEWHGSYGTKAQYNFWNYQSLYPVLTAGKTAAAGGPGKIAVVLTVRNLGAKKGTGMLYDVVPAGFTAGGFSLSPSSVTPNPDGTKTLQWEVSVNGYLDPPGSYDTTVFYTFGILYDLYPSPETDGARVFLPKAYVKYFDCVANREAISTLPVALNVDVDGDGHPACSDCNDFNPDIYTGCP
ncbi:MAG: hypothetical protein FJ088_04345, partial [Deltaproteobacteria bacterium]|nr:hypothetical protein [Deltaproteobacteria bacterium]